MTILQKLLQSGDMHAPRGWHWFDDSDQAVRHTEAWEHETFAEEQARWERSDLEYARMCEAVRQAKERGGEASRRADEAKAVWDARVATQRQANDDAQRAHHALSADQTARPRPPSSRTSSQRRRSRSREGTRTLRLVIRAREGHHHMHTGFAIESNDSPAPGIMPEPLRVHDQPALRDRVNDSPAPGIMPEPLRVHDQPVATTAPRAVRQAARLGFRGPATRNPVSNEATKLEVE